MTLTPVVSFPRNYANLICYTKSENADLVIEKNKDGEEESRKPYHVSISGIARGDVKKEDKMSGEPRPYFFVAPDERKLLLVQSMLHIKDQPPRRAKQAPRARAAGATIMKSQFPEGSFTPRRKTPQGNRIKDSSNDGK